MKSVLSSQKATAPVLLGDQLFLQLLGHGYGSCRAQIICCVAYLSPWSHRAFPARAMHCAGVWFLPLQFSLVLPAPSIKIAPRIPYHAKHLPSGIADPGEIPHGFAKEKKIFIHSQWLREVSLGVLTTHL